MPAGIHGLDDTPNDELATLVAAGGEQNVKVVLAVLATVKLIKHAVPELAEALRATENEHFLYKSSMELSMYLHEALLVPQLAGRVDNFLLRLKSFPAFRADHVIAGHVGGKTGKKNGVSKWSWCKMVTN